MSTLNAQARNQIKAAGVTIAGYVRWAAWSDGKWHGDRCGCTDDRCIGHHHDADDECQCLPVLLEQMQEEFPVLQAGRTLGRLHAVVFDLADRLTVDERLRRVEDILRESELEQ